MHGARRAAFDYIRTVTIPGTDQRVWRRGQKLFDVCCGAPPWLREHAIADGLDWYGVDQRPMAFTGYAQADLRRGMAIWRGRMFFDLAISVYGLQHLQEYEGIGWSIVRAQLKPDGYFLYFGNHAVKSFTNLTRQDPANVHSVESLKGLAIGSGFEMLEIQTYAYEPSPMEGYDLEAPLEQCNGLRALMRVRTAGETN